MMTERNNYGCLLFSAFFLNEKSPAPAPLLLEE